MFDVLNLVWSVMEAPDPVLREDVVDSWPQESSQRLRALRIIGQSEFAERILCPECRGHFETVIAREGPGGELQLFISCSEVGRVRLSPDFCRAWRLKLDRLPELMALALDLTGKVKVLEDDRLWHLGRTTWQGNLHDVLFARGLEWDDSPSIRSLIRRRQKPIVFVPTTIPCDEFWLGRVPPILAMADCATFTVAGIEFDSLALPAAIDFAKTASVASGVFGRSEEELTLKIRQQIKAEKATELTDGALTGAFRAHGSYRKAAEFLTRELGQLVSKDQVFRAVHRCGGPAAVMKSENSNSIERPVASQPRDRKGKRLHQSKPVTKEDFAQPESGD
jgi:hypothetical protein